MSFGKEMKRLREEANLSVQKIADLIGVSADRWRKWEEKDLKPRFEDGFIIEEFFGMGIRDIVKLESIREFLKVPKDAGAAVSPTEKHDQQQNPGVYAWVNPGTENPNLKMSGPLDQDLLLEILINQKATLQYLRELHEHLGIGHFSKKGRDAVSEVKEKIKKGKSAETDKHSNRGA